MQRRMLWLCFVLGFVSSIAITCFGQSPAISITSGASQSVVLSWEGEYALESASALSNPISWSALDLSGVLQNGRYTVTIPVGSRQQYFRLRGGGGPPLPTLVETSPASGEAGVSVNRETVLRFSHPIPITAKLDGETFYAEFAGRKLLSRIEISSDRRTATLFYLEPLPSGARIQVRFTGENNLVATDPVIDADGDGQPGGTALIEFDTMNTTALPGTVVIGHVYASELLPTMNGNTNQPLEGVLITVDGAEETIRAVTDKNGFFKLEPSPAGRFFVHIDGRPAVGSSWPNGAYYPLVGKTFEAVVGKTNNLAGGTGQIFLPLIRAGTLQAVSVTAPTTITFPADVITANPTLNGVSITVPPNSLFSDNGTRGGRVGIAPVPPDRIPSPLPVGLSFPVVITIQT
jgi:hypothetical protein